MNDDQVNRIIEAIKSLKGPLYLICFVLIAISMNLQCIGMRIE